MRKQFGDDYYAAEEGDADYAEGVDTGRFAQDEEGDEVRL
jgi:hypothetical protein